MQLFFAALYLGVTQAGFSMNTLQWYSVAATAICGSGKSRYDLYNNRTVCAGSGRSAPYFSGIFHTLDG